eukprot:INCI4018.1.p1 GENE.INCI4018.1~~INCI4018.1.p1  ORF type:complete len:369 (+),score=68.28 INCI4018.1:93-1109(+)
MSAAGNQIDSNEAALYDRQIRLWGVKAQNQLKNSRTLVVGLNALGAELCKNIVLAGLNVSVLDSHVVSARDIGTQFFLNAKDSGKARAVASVDRIRALNPYAHVDAIEGEVCEKDAPFFAQFNTVVLVNRSFAEESHVNKCCRENGKSKFIAAHSCGFFATAFMDFLRHEYVVTGPGGSILSETPQVVSYLSLEESMKLNWSDLTRQFKYGVSPLFACQQAQRLGVCSDHADAATAVFTALCTKNGLDESNTPTDTFLKWNASVGSHLSAVCAVMGGLLGQEVIKVISGQNRTCDNWLFLDGRTGEAVVQRLAIEAKAKAFAPNEDEIDDLLSLSDSE